MFGGGKDPPPKTGQIGRGWSDTNEKKAEKEKKGAKKCEIETKQRGQGKRPRVRT